MSTKEARGTTWKRLTTDRAYGDKIQTSPRNVKNKTTEGAPVRGAGCKRAQCRPDVVNIERRLDGLHTIRNDWTPTLLEQTVYIHTRVRAWLELGRS